MRTLLLLAALTACSAPTPLPMPPCWVVPDAQRMALIIVDGRAVLVDNCGDLK